MMNGSFNISVNLVGSATSQLQQLNRQMRAAQAPMRAFNRQMNQYKNLSGYNNAMRVLSQRIGTVRDGFTSVIRPMTALFGVGSISAVVSMTRRFSDWGNEIRNTSALLGITTTQATKLSQLGTLTGFGNQAQSLQRFQDVQTMIQAGGDSTGALADRELGITPSMDHDQAMIRALRYTQRQMRAGHMNASGARARFSAAGLDPNMVGYDPSRYEAQVRQASRNAAEIARSGALPVLTSLSDKLRELYGRLNVVTTELAGKFAPIIQPIVQSLIDWTNNGDNVNRVMDQLSSISQSVADAIKQIPFQKLFDDASNVVNLLGGPKGLLEIFLAIKAIQFTSWAVSFASALATVTAALGSMGTAAGVLTVISGPIGAVTALVTALGVAGYEMYEHWDKIGPMFKDLWSDITDTFDRGWDHVKGILDEMDQRLTGGKIGQLIDSSGAGIALGRQDAYGNSMSTADQKQNQQLMYDEYKSLGYTDAGAFAMIGNGMRESSLNPTATNGSHGGIFQWDTSRRNAIREHFGKDPTQMTVQEQVQAQDWEMGSRYKGIYSQIKNAQYAGTAADVVNRRYEVSAMDEAGLTKHQAQNLGYIEQAQHNVNLNIAAINVHHDHTTITGNVNGHPFTKTTQTKVTSIQRGGN